MTTFTGRSRFHGFHITLHPVILLVGAVIAVVATVGTRSAVMLVTFLPAIFILDILVDVLGIRALITLDPDQPKDQEAVLKDIGIDVPYVLLTTAITVLLFVFVVLPQYRVAAQGPAGIVTPPTVVPSIVPSLIPATVTPTETGTPTATATETAIPTATVTITPTPSVTPEPIVIVLDGPHAAQAYAFTKCLSYTDGAPWQEWNAMLGQYGNVTWIIDDPAPAGTGKHCPFVLTGSPSQGRTYFISEATGQVEFVDYRAP